MSSTKIFEAKDLTISAVGLQLLHKELVAQLGSAQAKILLFRVGYQLGQTKALAIKTKKSLLELLDTLEEIYRSLKLVSKARFVHSFNEHETFQNNLSGVWYDSLQAMAASDQTECQCSILCGLTSGFLSAVYEENIEVYEETCRAKGDAQCTFQAKTKQQCEQFGLKTGNTAATIERPISYEQLFTHHAILEKVSHYHNTLTDAILQQKDIKRILQIAFTTLNVPIYITDSRGQRMYGYGLTDEQLTTLSKHTTYFQRIYKDTSTKIQSYYVITAPIYLTNKLYATVSFVYFDALPDEQQFLFLNRLAVIASLYFLNDKVRFETTERLKNSFLDRLINQQFSNEKEMLRHSQYIKPALNAPYTIIAIHCKTVQQQEAPIDLYNQIFQLAHLMHFHQIEGLISVRDQELIVLAYQICDEATLQNTFTKILKELQKSNVGLHFKAGISNLFNELQHFESHLKQAEQALHLPRTKLIIAYKELGLLGTFISKMDGPALKKIAAAELGEVLLDEDKNKELLYTLYIYLKNNGKLEKTMYDLSLSIGGIKYRITKIEKIINKDLKDALTSSYLLMLIECLLVLNEIKF